MRDTSRERAQKEKALRERRKFNSTRNVSSVDETLDETLRAWAEGHHLNGGGENARDKRVSELQREGEQICTRDNVAVDQRDSAVPLGGARARHQGPMREGRVGTPGGHRGDGDGNVEDTVGYPATQQLYNGPRKLECPRDEAEAMIF